MGPEPTETQKQLGLTIYRMGHGCPFKVAQDAFPFSKSLATS